jgi:arginyl-tRNA synthetase
MTNIFGDFRRVLLSALDTLAAEGALPAGLDVSRVAVEPPRDPAHGDLATNAAMVLAGQAKQNPMALAERIAAGLQGRELVSGDYRGAGFTVDAVRPGFLNIRLESAVWHAQLRAILESGTAHGHSTIGGGEKVNVEFVSANPTGPMHVGHGRGAVVGDALAALLAKAGLRCIASITSTMPARRSTRSLARSISATRRSSRPSRKAACCTVPASCTRPRCRPRVSTPANT